MQHVKMAALSLAVLGLGTSQIGHAIESDAWQYEVTPYILTAGLGWQRGYPWRHQ